MIDLHCHILPGLDDGALSLQDAVAMARQAQEDGIQAVCATPHIRHDHKVQIEEIASRVATVQRQLDGHGVDVQILPGGELAETQADLLTDPQLQLVALGGAGGWLLLEPAPGPLGDSLLDLAHRLAARGMRSVIAHPERHAGGDFYERLHSLVANGCLIQWTAEFLAQTAPAEMVCELAERGFVHLLGSDAHSSYGGRPVRLAAAFERLAGAFTPEQLRWAAEDAPQAIVRGEPVTPPFRS